jgi:hypothetical protein
VVHLPRFVALVFSGLAAHTRCAQLLHLTISLAPLATFACLLEDMDDMSLRGRLGVCAIRLSRGGRGRRGRIGGVVVVTLNFDFLKDLGARRHLDHHLSLPNVVGGGGTSGWWDGPWNGPPGRLGWWG